MCVRARVCVLHAHTPYLSSEILGKAWVEGVSDQMEDSYKAQQEVRA